MSSQAMVYMGIENATESSSVASSSPDSSSSQSQSLLEEERRRLHSQIYSGQARNWNEEFQSLFDKSYSNMDQEMERVQQLRQLCEEFALAATRIGKIIISELSLSNEDKSIPPIQRVVGGAAGGAKFFHEGIFFKFPDNSMKLYDSEESLMKSLGHELKGMMAYMDCRIKDLHFPLMVLVDYHGWRLLAQSVLPVDGLNTLVYGSANGTKTIHCDSPQFLEKMERAASILNLSPEWVYTQDRSNKVQLFSSCDVEGHKGNDGRFYLVDTARVLPPATPIKGKPSSFLWNLLRPELVKANPEPLCADAFSGFFLEDKQKHNELCQQATGRLETDILPRFVDTILMAGHPLFGPTLASSNTVYNPQNADFEKLILSMHQNGINMRYMGQIYNLVSVKPDSAPMRRALMTEMVARVAKHDLKAQMRQMQSTDAGKFIKLVTDFFNKLFGRSDESLIYWQQKIRQSLFERFNGIKPVEKNVPFAGVSVPALFRRVQRLVGLEFTDLINAKFDAEDQDDWSQLIALEKPFSAVDVQSINAVVKHIHRIYFEEGYALCRLALTTNGAASLDQRDLLLDMASSLYEESLRVKPNDIKSLHNLGYSMFLKATSSSICDTRLVERAMDLFKQAVQLEPRDFKSMFVWAQCLVEIAKSSINASEDIAAGYDLFQEALDKYAEAAQAAKRAPRESRAKIQFLWASCLLARADTSMFRHNSPPISISQSIALQVPIDAEQDLNSALTHLEQALQLEPNEFDFLLNYAAALSKRARVPTVKSHQEAKPWFDKAFACFEKAAQIRPHSFEVFFNWGNAIYRSTKIWIDSIVKRDKTGAAIVDQARQRLLLQEMRTQFRAQLNKAVHCYSTAVNINPLRHSPFSNWSRVISLMAEMENALHLRIVSCGTTGAAPVAKKKRPIDVSNRSSKRRKLSEDGESPSRAGASTDALDLSDSDEDDPFDTENEQSRIEYAQNAGKEFIRKFRDALIKDPSLKPSPLLDLGKIPFLTQYVEKQISVICQALECLARPPAELIQELRARGKKFRAILRATNRRVSRTLSSESIERDLFTLSVDNLDKMQVDDDGDDVDARNGAASAAISKEMSSILDDFVATAIVPDQVWEIVDSKNSNARYALKAIPTQSLRQQNTTLITRLLHGQNIFFRGDPVAAVALTTGALPELPSEDVNLHGTEKDLEDNEEEPDTEEEEDLTPTQTVEAVSTVSEASKQHFLVPIVGFFLQQEPPKVFIALPWVPAAFPLDEFVSKHHPLRADVVSFLAAEILLAIERLHALKVVALVIRPNNILIDREGHARLLPPVKFRAGVDHEAFAHLLSPEAIEGVEEPFVDYWAFGTLLYFLLTGKDAFGGDSLKFGEVIDAVSQGHAYYPSTLPPDAVDLLKCLFNPNRELRYTDAVSIRNHRFFSGINWMRIRTGRRQSPVFPSVHNVASSSNLESTQGQGHERDDEEEISATLVMDGERNDFMGRTFVFSQTQLSSQGFSQLAFDL